MVRRRTQPTHSTQQCREGVAMHTLTLQFSDLSIKIVFSSMNQVEMGREDGFPEQTQAKTRMRCELTVF